MKKYLFFTVLVLFLSSVFALNAQTKKEFQFGLAIPQGDFADDDEDDAIFDGSGVAGTGFYLGYKQLTPLSTDGLYWTFNAGIMYNDFQSDFKEDLEDEMDDFDDYSLPKYINIPVIFGLQYEKDLDDGLTLYGEAGAGVNILKLTNLSASEDDYESKITFKPSVKLGYKIGAGIVLQEKYTISLNYLGLGSHKVKYESESEYYGESDSDDDKFDKALSISSVNLTVGIRF